MPCSSRVAAGAAHADGLAEYLKEPRWRGCRAEAPLKASVQAHDWRRTGGAQGREGDARARSRSAWSGRAAWPCSRSTSHELLARADAESRAAVKDKTARKPLSQALGQLDFNELRALSSAAPALQREIEDARFTGETADAWAGKPARKLQFESSVDSLSEDDRKYVRDYKLQLSVWIGADGTPLASRRHLEVSGRAFVVISFEHHSDDQRSYAVAGDRMVALTEKEEGSSKGAGETQAYRIERSLQVLP